MSTPSWLCHCCCIFLLSLTASAYAAIEYQVIDLGTQANVASVDPQGNGVGGTEGNNAIQAGFLDGQAMLWTLQGAPVPLGTLPQGTFAQALARDGVHGTVGYANTNHLGGTPTHAFLRYRGTFRDLGTTNNADPNLYSAATALNASAIVGWGTSPDGNTNVPLAWWWQGGAAIRLATLGGVEGIVNGMTPSSVAVGASETPTLGLHATLWIMGFPTDLTPDLEGVTEAFAVNMSLMIVGDANNEGFVWMPQTGLVTPLGTLPGDQHSSLRAVNNHGVAVGFSVNTMALSFAERGVRCIAQSCVDINTLVHAPQWVLEELSGINDNGVISGIGRFQGNQARRGFLLRPLR